MKYPLAKNGVFATVQGEGALLGVPMAFVRLAGCSVGCPLCDTDYKVSERVSVPEIVERIDKVRCNRWVWITGGEPTDHNLLPLLESLCSCGLWPALATSGHKAIASYDRHVFIKWLSVSPHDPAKWVQRTGDEIKLVPSLNGFGLRDFDLNPETCCFGHRYVQPCDGKPETVAECVEFVSKNHGWLMTCQAHKQWVVQ